VDETSGGGYIIAGYTSSFGTGGDEVYLVKVDQNGNTLWTGTYGGPLNERALCVHQTIDGGFIDCGWRESFGTGNKDFYVIRLGSPVDVKEDRLIPEETDVFLSTILDRTLILRIHSEVQLNMRILDVLGRGIL